MKHYLLILTAALVAFNASAQKTEKLTASLYQKDRLK